jgi:hypothetical protein
MKRKHEPQTNTNKRRCWPSDMVDMFKGLYEEAVRKAERRIACHPVIFAERYIAGVTKWREMLGEAAPDDVVDALIARNLETNALARTTWQARYDAMHAASTIPYYFIGPSGFDDHLGLMTPVGQLDLLSHIIERPELVPQLQAWLDHRTEAHYRDLTADQRSALSRYTFNGYHEVWKAFESGNVESSGTASQIAQVFQSTRDDPIHNALPVGLCLFEGQGYHPEEDDLCKLRLTDEQLPYSMTSHRPRSTSIVPNVGIHYASMCTTFPTIKPHVRHWHLYPEAFEALDQWALHNGEAKASGCLVRYYVRGSVSAIPLWASSFVKSEAEVLLPPGCKLTVFKIDRGVY